MKIIIGLGNPGEEYENTRHNAGYKVVDQIRETLDFPEFKKKRKFKALYSEGEYRDEKIVLIKPLTFMNKSGDCVAAAARNKIFSPDKLLVVVDDVDTAATPQCSASPTPKGPSSRRTANNNNHMAHKHAGHVRRIMPKQLGT